jgi:hypothetical protein
MRKKKMMRKKKDRLLEGLPPLKKVEGELPYVFDLFWDIKYAEDLDKDDKNNSVVQRLLAENGYDVKEWLQR